MLTLPGGSLLKWQALLCGSVFSYSCFPFSSLFQFSFHSLSISSLISFSRFSHFSLCILYHQPASFWNRWAGEARKWGWAAIAGNKTLGPIVWIPVAHWHSVRLQWHTPYELCLSWTRPEITSRINSVNNTRAERYTYSRLRSFYVTLFNELFFLTQNLVRQCITVHKLNYKPALQKGYSRIMNPLNVF